MLSPSQRQVLRQKAHHLRPIILVGQNGVSDAVMFELDIALTAHELVKIKLTENDKTARKEQITELCERSRAELVQSIGKTVVVYRERED